MTRTIVAFLMLVSINTVLANDLKILNVSFPGAMKPRTEIDSARNFYTNHFSVSSSYEMNVKVEANVPGNTMFTVRTYAIVRGSWISLGAARLGHADVNTGPISVSYNIFPSAANYYGPCQFVVRVDAHNEVAETDENNNDWIFQATVHPPG